MNYDTHYVLTNDSGVAVGPLDLFDIFGPCDAEPQVVTLAPAQVLAFMAVHEDTTVVQDRLKTRLKTLGFGLGAGGVVMDHQPEIILLPKPEPQPPPPAPAEPPDEAD